MTVDRKPLVTVVASYDGETFLPKRLFEAYESFGFEVQYLGWDRLRHFPPHRTVDNIPHRFIMRGWGFANRKLVIALPLWTLRLAAHIATLRTDLIHVIDFDAGLGVAIGARARGTPFVYDIQDNFELRHHYIWPVRLAIRKLDNWIIERSASTIVVGEERIVGDMKRYRSKVAVIPNCPADVAPPADLKRNETCLTLAAVGRIADTRGMELLLVACRRLPWLRVLMAGDIEGAELGKELRACCQIELHGYMPQKDALGLVHRSDCSFAFINPSLEGARLANGAKWYDAMMAGKPLLINSEIACAEWIHREKIGYLSPYGDADQFVQTLTYLYEHRIEMTETGARARRLYETKFNRTAMNRKLFDIVHAVNGRTTMGEI